MDTSRGILDGDTYMGNSGKCRAAGETPQNACSDTGYGILSESLFSYVRYDSAGI